MSSAYDILSVKGRSKAMVKEPIMGLSKKERHVRLLAFRPKQRQPGAQQVLRPVKLLSE